jgi:hypothetical protein
MMVHMRHMGNSGKLAVVTGIAAAGLLVLTGMTLAMPVFNAFLGVLALAYLAAIAEVLARGRRAVLLATGAGTALTLAFALAFLSTWELTYDGQSSFLGTPLPTDDPDDYFIGAAVSAVSTLLVLFAGAIWPAGRGIATAPPRKPAPKRRPATVPRTAANPRQAGKTAQRASSSRTPVRTPTAAKRPPSSAAPARRPVAKPGASPRR